MAAQNTSLLPLDSQRQNIAPTIGAQIGRLMITAIKTGTNGFRVTCLCDCGNTWEGHYSDLFKRRYSCGCLEQERHRKDYTGKQFGRLTVLSMTWEPDEAPTRKGRLRGMATCLCVCGVVKKIATRQLGRSTNSCGCSHQKDYSEQRFGRLIVQRMVQNKRHRFDAECLCDCGNITIVRPALLQRDRTLSCGCLRHDWLQSIRKPLQYRREVARLGRHRRRSLLQNLPMHFTQQHLHFLLQYWHFSCVVCGREDGGLWHILALDHFIPITNPACPGTVPGNMLLLCQNRKGSRQYSEVPGCNHNKWAKDPVLWLSEKLGLRKAKKKLHEIDAYFAAVNAFAREQETTL